MEFVALIVHEPPTLKPSSQTGRRISPAILREAGCEIHTRFPWMPARREKPRRERALLPDKVV
jgi:hypothetical protein